MENALNLDTVKLAENKKEIVILDQTLLPNECKYLSISKAGDIWEAIYSLRVRGAPAIGVTGAYAYYVLADQIETEDKDKFVKECTEMMEYINSSRPTAVNLSWALNRMHNVMLTEKDHMNIPDLKVRLMKDADLEPEQLSFSPENLAKLIGLTEERAINSSVAKEVFEHIFNENIDPVQYVEENGLRTVADDGALRATIEEIVSNNPQSVEDYRAGKKKAIGFLVGQTMKATQGKADPGMVNQILTELLQG